MNCPVCGSPAEDTTPHTFDGDVFRRDAGMAMFRCFLALLLTLPLTACFSDNETNVARCQREMAREIATFDSSSVLDEDEARYFLLFPKEDIYMVVCMKAAGYGYVRDGSAAKCNFFQGSMSKNPYCYAPRGRLENLLLQIELKLGLTN
jgi:hypothetical protein